MKEIIENKTVIITGGSRGIGKAIVEELANLEYNIVLGYFQSEQKAKEIQDRLLSIGKKIEIYKVDITKREEVKGLIDFTLNKYKTVDVFINNAGISQTKLFTDILDEDWDKMIQTNLTSAFYCCQEIIPTMIHNKKGLIINISSIWGITGASCEVHYSVAKAGLNGLTKALAKEVGPCNIRVNAIAPGMIETDMNIDYSLEEKEEIKKEIPLGKIGDTKEIAKCVKWLIEGEYTTGQIISINGGWQI